MKNLLSIVCFLLLSFSLSAQTSGYKDIVKLKQGHTVQGEIIKWVHDEYIILRLVDGAEVKFPFEAIEKITQKDLSGKQKSIKEYAFSENGLYNSTSFDASLNEQSGYGITHTIGWQYSRLFG